MLKSIYMSIAFGVLFSLQIMVQQNQLQNPETRKYESWESANYSTTMMINESKQSTKAKAKNEQAKALETKKELTPVKFTSKRKLTGRRTKNMRPVRNNANRMFDN